MTDAEYLTEVGMRVLAARLRRRLSQHAFADRMPMSRVTLGSVERGQHVATLTTYRKLAAALGVDVGDLVTERVPTWR